MQINEKPKAIYVNAMNNEMGHDFPKDKGVGMLSLNQFGEKPCVMGRTHQSFQLPFFLSSLPNHLFCQKVLEVVIVIFSSYKASIMILGSFNWENNKHSNKT